MNSAKATEAVGAGALNLCKEAEGPGTGLPEEGGFGGQGTSDPKAVLSQYLGYIYEKVELAYSAIWWEIKRQ